MSAPDSHAAATPPVVSVAITTYNSQNWIARALDSVLLQQTSCPFEIVIADDCSADSTIALARAYQQRYPNIIRVIERPRNIGIQRNYYDAFENCHGRYIAWLDADDYWTDPEKLAIQVALLESDPTITVCGHFVRWIKHDGSVYRDRYPAVAAGRYGMDEILRRNILASPSILFRNGLHRELPAWYFDLAPTTDWPLWVIAALKGDIVLLDRVMADYILTPNSTLMGQGSLAWLRTDARFYEHIDGLLPKKWRRLARSEKGKRYEALAYALRQQGDLPAARSAAWKAFLAPVPLDNLGSKTKALAVASLRELQAKLRYH